MKDLSLVQIYRLMNVHHLGLDHSLLNWFVAQIRDKTVQQDSMRFRRNMERIGEIIGYEMSKTFDYRASQIQTPLGTKEVYLPENNLVLCAVLRAGLPLHQGMLNCFDSAENAFVSAYRHHPEGTDDFEVRVNYFAAPTLEGKTLIINDPMLATGRTLENVLEASKGHGKPEQIHIVSVIGSEEGVSYIRNVFPKNTHLWIAAIDEQLTSSGYIVPGLGDAGDLAYRAKL